MNERLKRLMQLLELKKEATHSAYQKVLMAQDEFKQNKLKHEQLATYRQDYVIQLDKIGQEGSVLGRLRNRINFITHLDTALIQLNGHLAYLAKIRTKAEQYYKQAKVSEEGVSLLIERVKKEVQEKLLRIEQKENDEYAQKQWYSKKMNETNDINE